MGRKKTIDRDALLDIAEEIVTTQGASALTIDAIAKRAGITKGGVQYSFASKDALIDAMFERSTRSYTQAFEQLAGPAPSPRVAMRAHIEASRQSDATANAKAASLMSGLLQTPEHLASTRQWYRERLAAIDPTTEEGRRARLAFFATEGAFLLRFCGFMDFADGEWDGVIDDALGLIPPTS